MTHRSNPLQTINMDNRPNSVPPSEASIHPSDPPQIRHLFRVIRYAELILRAVAYSVATITAVQALLGHN